MEELTRTQTGKPLANTDLPAARQKAVAQGVNSALVLLSWQMSRRILTDIPNAKRATAGGLL